MGDHHFSENHFFSDHFTENHFAGQPVPDPCPNGHFGSRHFSSGTFVSYHFAAVCIPVPPVRQGGGSVGGGATWGGVHPKFHEHGMRRPRRPGKAEKAILGAFVSKVAEDLTSTITEGMKQKTHADPLEALKKGTTPDKVKEGMIRALRKRITALEENIRKLKGLHIEDLAELEQSLADQIGETETLEAVIRQLEDDLRIETVRAMAYRAARTRADQMLAEYPEDRPTTGTTKLVVGALAYLAVEFLVPERMGALKDAGRVMAAGVAISGLSDLLQ